MEPNTSRSNDLRPKLQKDAQPAAAIITDIARSRAVLLRVKGHSFRAIAKHLGVSVETAHRYVNDRWTRINDQTDEERARLRDLQEARLDLALRVVMRILAAKNLVVVTGDGDGHEVRLPGAELQLKAIDRLVKISHRQSQLRGLDSLIKEEPKKPKSELEPLDVLIRRVEEAKTRRAAMKCGKLPVTATSELVAPARQQI